MGNNSIEGACPLSQSGKSLFLFLLQYQNPIMSFEEVYFVTWVGSTEW